MNQLSNNIQDSETDYLLLSQIQKEIQALTIGNSIVYLSVQDDLPIGKGTDLGGTFDQDLYVYAEQLTLNNSLSLKNALLSTSFLVANEQSTIELYGDPGTTPTDNINGTDGKAGGVLQLFIGEVPIDDPKFSIHAKGGKGGDGQDVPASLAGNGGNGGAGGNVTSIQYHPYAMILHRLVEIYKMVSLKEKLTAISDLKKRYGQYQIISPLFQNAESNPDQNSFNQTLHNVAFSLQTALGKSQIDAQMKIDVSGGAYGVYGEGKPNGNDGKSGGMGKTTLIEIGDPSQFATLNQQSFFPWIHSVQCQMLQEKAKMAYFCLDPQSQDAVEEISIYFQRLQKKTAPFQFTQPGDALDKLWSASEHIIGAQDSIATFKKIYDNSVIYLNSLSRGNDYFGYPYNYVPVLSFDFCREQFQMLVSNFDVIEDHYNNQINLLKDVTKAKDALLAARNQAESKMNSNNSKLTKISEMYENTAKLINSYTPSVEQKKQIANEKLQEIKDDLANHFDWNWDDLFASLGSLAFAPTESVMWIEQASKIAFDGMTKITDNTGAQINKDYLVDQISSVKDDISSLKENFSTLPDGTIQPDDPGAAKLIGDEDSIESILNQISSRIDITEAREALQDYVSTISERNNQIVTYNTLISLFLKTQNEQSDLNGEIVKYNDSVIDALTEVSPVYVAFVSRMYFEAVSQLIEMIYLAARSYQFWALSVVQPNTLLGGNPGQITYADLTSAKSQILQLYSDAVTNFKTNPSIFPANSANTGIEYNCKPLQVELMKNNFETMVTIPVSDKTTSNTDSPFSGLSNVRITKVRCYLHGAQPKDHLKNSEVLINISHTGTEKIVSPNNHTFLFQHDKREVPFKYDLNSSIISIDGDFGVHYPEEATPYALFGPFTTWKIEIDPSFRDQLDLSNLEDVTLEFYGTCYSFNT